MKKLIKNLERLIWSIRMNGLQAGIRENRETQKCLAWLDAMPTEHQKPEPTCGPRNGQYERE